MVQENYSQAILLYLCLPALCYYAGVYQIQKESWVLSRDATIRIMAESQFFSTIDRITPIDVEDHLYVSVDVGICV